MTKTNSDPTGNLSISTLINFNAPVSSSCFDSFEHSDIRILNLFRISKFGFRVFSSLI
ncbi:hypothetical protein D1AOALGA4SA_648 [Olavius algarvensis Delta 1 endosymbiont]|nr:hypothetical protein D1AOALGA4SA_648 [Olavius algarvensis Delta 1 endosymbiont]